MHCFSPVSFLGIVDMSLVQGYAAMYCALTEEVAVESYNDDARSKISSSQNYNQEANIVHLATH